MLWGGLPGDSLAWATGVCAGAAAAMCLETETRRFPSERFCHVALALEGLEQTVALDLSAQGSCLGVCLASGLRRVHTREGARPREMGVATPGSRAAGQDPHLG